MPRLARSLIVVLLSTSAHIHAAALSPCDLLLGSIERNETLSSETISAELRALRQSLRQFPYLKSSSSLIERGLVANANILKQVKWTTGNVRTLNLKNLAYAQDVDLALHQLLGISGSTQVLRSAAAILEDPQQVQEHLTALITVAGVRSRGFSARFFRRPTFELPDLVSFVQATDRLSRNPKKYPHAMAIFNATYALPAQELIMRLRAFSDAGLIQKAAALEISSNLGEAEHLAVLVTFAYRLDKTTARPRLLFLANYFSMGAEQLN